VAASRNVHGRHIQRKREMAAVVLRGILWTAVPAGEADRALLHRASAFVSALRICHKVA